MAIEDGNENGKRKLHRTNESRREESRIWLTAHGDARALSNTFIYLKHLFYYLYFKIIKKGPLYANVLLSPYTPIGKLANPNTPTQPPAPKSAPLIQPLPGTCQARACHTPVHQNAPFIVTIFSKRNAS